MKINKYKLDDACIQQIEMMEEVTYNLANAKQALEEAKNHYTLAKSQVSADVRKNPMKYNLGKVTESQVTSQVDMSPVVAAAQSKLAEAKFSVSQLEGELETLKHRKSMVESLIYLHGAGYFSSVRPAEPQEVQKTEAGDNDSGIPSRRIRK